MSSSSAANPRGVAGGSGGRASSSRGSSAGPLSMAAAAVDAVDEEPRTAAEDDGDEEEEEDPLPDFEAALRLEDHRRDQQHQQDMVVSSSSVGAGVGVVGLISLEDDCPPPPPPPSSAAALGGGSVCFEQRAAAAAQPNHSWASAAAAPAAAAAAEGRHERLAALAEEDKVDDVESGGVGGGGGVRVRRCVVGGVSLRRASLPEVPPDAAAAADDEPSNFTASWYLRSRGFDAASNSDLVKEVLASSSSAAAAADDAPREVVGEDGGGGRRGGIAPLLHHQPRHQPQPQLQNHSNVSSSDLSGGGFWAQHVIDHEADDERRQRKLKLMDELPREEFLGERDVEAGEDAGAAAAAPEPVGPAAANVPANGDAAAADGQPPTHRRNTYSQYQGPYNWQSTKMTVKERLTFMFNNEILSDVHFCVGKEATQQRIPAHRFVLSVGSAVFDAMFNSTLANREDEVVLPDVEPASFLALLRFLYSDEVQIGPDSVMTTLYTAKKYAVPALEKHCVDFLKHNLSADNAFMLLTQARLFDEPQLAALCLETIDKSTPEALSAEGFTDIDIDTLSAVLDRDSLRIKEARLFTSLLRWAESECARQGLPGTTENKRSVLGHVLTKIRFPLMTVEEFAQGPAQSGILTDRECVSLFLHFTVNPKPPVGFLDVPRCSMTGKELTVCRFQQIESRWGYSGTSDKIRFIVDRRIFVVGFGLYGSIHGPSEYQVCVQIIHTGSGRLLGSNEFAFLSDGTNSTFRVMFKEPIEIQSNTNYTAASTLKGLDSHYGTKGLRKCWVECPTGGRVTFQFSYAAGNNNGTSVEDGQIPEIIFYT